MSQMDEHKMLYSKNPWVEIELSMDFLCLSHAAQERLSVDRRPPLSHCFYYSIFFLFENVTKILVMHSFIKQKKTDCIRMFAGIVNSINFGTWWSSKKKG